MTETGAATVVLVHGAGAGAWTWHLLVDTLTDRGVDARAIDLPSCSSADNTIGPGDDARHVREVLDEIEAPIVLTGNSYGGYVMSEAATGHPRVRHLVYLAAIMPRPGDALLDVIAEATVPSDELGLTFLEDGRIVFEPEADLRSSYHLAPATEVAYIRKHLGRPMSLGTEEGPRVQRVAWESIPSTYIVCAEDRALRPDVQRSWAKKRATNAVELPVDHCPQHSHPELIADVLKRLAKAAT